MTTITFDTLDAARSLRAAGVDEKTAEAIVAVVQRTADLPDINGLATKAQIDDRIDNLEKRLIGAIGDLRAVTFGLFLTNMTAVLGVAALVYNLLKH